MIKPRTDAGRHSQEIRAKPADVWVDYKSSEKLFLTIWLAAVSAKSATNVCKTETKNRAADEQKYTVPGEPVKNLMFIGSADRVQVETDCSRCMHADH